MKKKVSIIALLLVVTVALTGYGLYHWEHGNKERIERSHKVSEKIFATGILETAKKDSDNAKELLVECKDNQAYDDSVRNVLNYYYSNNSSKEEIESFTEGLEPSGKLIAENFKNAGKEREQKDQLNYATGQVLVLFDKNTSDNEIKGIAMNNRNSVEEIVNLDVGKLSIIDLSLEFTVDEGSRKLAREDGVIAVQPDFIYQISEETQPEPDPALPPNEATTQSLPNDKIGWFLEYVNAMAAWDKLPDNGTKVRVAVIDTGVRPSHEDLTNVLNKSLSATIESGVITAGTISDDDGHGTHVAGIIAAEANNDKGIAGVASGYSSNNQINNNIVDLMVIDAQRQNGFYTSDLITSINYATRNNAKIINLSLGGAGHNEILARVLRNATNQGVLIVCAGGNEQTDRVVYPADLPEVIGVINNNNIGGKSISSNFGYEKDISAPGASILSTGSTSDTSYITKGGTSMASPVVTGVAAMMLYAKPDMTPKQIKNILYATTNKEDFGINYGFGIVNSEQAVVSTLDLTAEQPTSIVLNRTTGTTAEGNTIYLEPKVEPAKTNLINLTWSSNNTGVATVSNGTVTGVAPGSAVITATTSNGLEAKCEITVIPKYTNITQYPYTSTKTLTTSSPMSTAVEISGDSYRYYSSYMNGYSYLGKAGETITVTASSTDMDGYIKILDATKKCVAKNDDESATSTNAKIVYKLPKDGMYFFEVTEAFDQKLTLGTTTFTFSTDAPPKKPEAPKNLLANTWTIESIELTWTSVPDASGYNLYRSKSQTGPFEYITSTRASRFLDTSLEADTTYYYRITAYTWIGDGRATASIPSDIAQSTTLKMPPKEGPSNVVATAINSNKVYVSWDAVPSTSGYNVYRQETPDGPFIYIGSTTRSYINDAKVLPDRTYAYKVATYTWLTSIRAVSSQRSAEARVVTPSINLTAPTVSIGSYDSNHIILMWLYVPGATGYEIYRGLDPAGEFTKVKTLTMADPFVFNDIGLACGTTYYYKIRAICHTATGIKYGPFTDTRGCKASPRTPTVTFGEVDKFVAINWTSSLAVDGYVVNRSTSQYSGYSWLSTIAGTDTEFYDKTAISGETYYYRVCAFKYVDGKPVFSGWSTPKGVVSK